jgi:hypothetical protein
MSSVGNATATGLVQNSVEKKKRIFRWGLNRGGHSAPKSGTKLWIAVAVLICAGTVHAQTVRASKPKPLIGVSPTSACRALDKQMPHYMLVSSDDFAETVLLSKLRKCLSGSSRTSFAGRAAFDCRRYRVARIA